MALGFSGGGMATVASARAVLRADTAGFKRDLKTAEKDFDRTTQSLSGKASSVGKSMESLGRGLTRAVTLPIVGLAGAAVKAFADYEAQMNNLQAVTGATANEMAALSAKAKELGADMSLPGTSAADAAAAMGELAKGGLSVADSMDAAKGVLQLSAAAQVSNAEAAEITADALNAFGLAGSDAVRVADLLAQSANATTADIGEMAEALKQSSAVANQLGIPIEDLTTALALMANAGIKGSDAGTSVKTMLLRLNPTTDKAAKLMAELGFSAFDANGSMLPLPDIIARWQKATAGMTQEQRLSTMQTLFGTDAIRAASTVLGTGAKDWDRMAATLGKSGAAAELAQAKMKGVRGALEGLKSQAETAAVIFGERLAPMVERVTRRVADLVARLAELSPKAQDTIIKFAAVAAALGPGLLIFGRLIRIVAAIGPALTKLRVGLAVLAAPVGLVVAAVGAVIAVFVLAWKHSERFRDAVGGLVAAFKHLWTALEVVVSAITGGGGAGGVMKAIGDALAAAGEAIGNVLAPAVEFADGLIRRLVSFLLVHQKQIAAGFARAGDAIQVAFTAAWAAVKPVLTALFDFVRDVATRVVDVIRDKWSAISGVATRIASGVRDAFMAIVGYVAEVFGRVASAIGSHSEEIRATFAALAAWIETALRVWVEVITRVFNFIWPWVVEATRIAWGYVKGVINAALKIIGGIIKTVMAVIRGDWGAAWKGIKQIIGGVWDAIKNTIKTTLNAIKLVIELAWNAIKALLGPILGGIRDVIVGAWDTIKTKVMKPVHAVRDVIKDAFTNVKDWTKEKVDQVVGFFTGIPGRLKGLGTALADVLKTAFKAGINAIISVINAIKIPSKHVHVGVPGPDWLTGPDIDFTFPSIDPFPDIAPLRTGGVIGVGRRDRDSVVALLSRGEIVLNEAQQRKLGGGAFLQRLLGLPIIRRGGPVPLATGGWVYPLASKGSILGTPNSGTHTLGNWPSDNAVDIGVPVGTPVVAVASGTLSGASYGGPPSSRFGGWGIYLTTPSGTVWYKHLTSVSRQSGTVTKGDVIGTSGAGNGVPHIHFAAKPPTSPYAMANAPLRSTSATPSSPSAPSKMSSAERKKLAYANQSARTAPNVKHDKTVASGRAFRWGGLYWGPGISGGKADNFKAWLQVHGGSWSQWKSKNGAFAALLEHGTTVPKGKRQSAPTPGDTDPGGDLDLDPGDGGFDTGDDYDYGDTGDTGDTGGGYTDGGDTTDDSGSGGATAEEIEAQIQERLLREKDAVFGARRRFLEEFSPNVFTPGAGGLELGASGPLKNVVVHQYFNRPPDDQFTLLRRARFAADAAFGSR